jgi:hypothetical protein
MGDRALPNAEKPKLRGSTKPQIASIELRICFKNFRKTLEDVGV